MVAGGVTYQEQTCYRGFLGTWLRSMEEIIRAMSAISHFCTSLAPCLVTVGKHVSSRVYISIVRDVSMY